MTVKQLIEELSKYPPGATIWCDMQEGAVDSVEMPLVPNSRVEIRAGGYNDRKPKPTWRHAVIFEGSPLADRQHEEIAKELLAEWGIARGLVPRDYVTQERDYRIGHGMEFSGEMLPPAGPQGWKSRLQGIGVPVPEMLAGSEEGVPWPLPEGWRSPAFEEAA